MPGHERFVKNMLAGVGGIDLAMLVVAADEGVMPQTREHLAILDLLGVSCGVVVVTKSDLVDSDWLEVVISDVAELVAGTALEGAPVVSCSAVSGAGLDELLATLETTLAGRGQRRDTGRPRLPIDRVFTVAGFGTVVTGTLIEGALHVGDEVEILPAFSGGQLSSRRARVRTLQNHGSDTDTAQPGTRTAVNLAGVEVGDLTRGQVVTVPGWLSPSCAVDVRLKALDDLAHPLRHNLNVSFHCFAAETPAQLRLLAQDELEPGSEGWAQLRLVNPVAVVKGDRFVIRDANGTVGGGVVLVTQAPRHVRNRPDVLARLEQLHRGEPSDVILAAIAASEPASVESLAVESGLAPRLPPICSMRCNVMARWCSLAKVLNASRIPRQDSTGSPPPRTTRWPRSWIAIPCGLALVGRSCAHVSDFRRACSRTPCNSGSEQPGSSSAARSSRP